MCLIHDFAEAPEGDQDFSGNMGYQGWVLEAILKGGRIMEFMLCLSTKSRHVHNAGGSNVASYGVNWITYIIF